MGCSAAMALLALCSFSFAGEPVSPHAGVHDRQRPAQEMQDWRAGGAYPDRVMAAPRAERRGTIRVRTRGE